MSEAPADHLKLRDKVGIKWIEFKMWFDAHRAKTKLYPWYRWISFLVVASCFALRMVIQKRFYLIGYVSGLYFVGCIVNFLSPKVDPEMGEELPRSDSRPFIRKLPEFSLWKRGMTAAILSHVATLVPLLDPPLSGGLMLGYFVLLTIFSLKLRIEHMIRNQYLPFDWGKNRKKDDA